jgi:hypothetical protein
MFTSTHLEVSMNKQCRTNVASFKLAPIKGYDWNSRQKLKS